MESTLSYSTTIEPSENVPHVHENLHPSNLTLINIKNFRFLINQDICNISQIGKQRAGQLPTFSSRFVDS